MYFSLLLTTMSFVVSDSTRLGLGNALIFTDLLQSVPRETKFPAPVLLVVTISVAVPSQMAVDVTSDVVFS